MKYIFRKSNCNLLIIIFISSNVCLIIVTIQQNFYKLHPSPGLISNCQFKRGKLSGLIIVPFSF